MFSYALILLVINGTDVRRVCTVLVSRISVDMKTYNVYDGETKRQTFKSVNKGHPGTDIMCPLLPVLTSSACPDGFEAHMGSCYAILPVKASWAEAKTYCSAIGAELAVVGSKSESDFVHGYLLREHSTISTSQIWIGGTDLLQEGVWRAPDNGEALSFLNWAPGEPDNLGGQHCLAIFNAGALQWDDNLCEVHNFALCKISNFDGESIIG